MDTGTDMGTTDIAEMTIKAIIDHNPIFTVGHNNVHGFDSKVLAIELGSSHAMSKYFGIVMYSNGLNMNEFD